MEVFILIASYKTEKTKFGQQTFVFENYELYFSVYERKERSELPHGVSYSLKAPSRAFPALHGGVFGLLLCCVNKFNFHLLYIFSSARLCLLAVHERGLWYASAAQL